MVSVKIRNLRNSKGFSQEYVAEKLRISQNTYSKLESGQIRLTVDRMKELSEIFDVEPEYFLQNDSFVNNNIGIHSKGIGIIYADTYYEGEKDISVIKKLEAQLEEYQQEISRLISIIESDRKDMADLIQILKEKNR